MHYGWQCQCISSSILRMSFDNANMRFNLWVILSSALDCVDAIHGACSAHSNVRVVKKKTGKCQPKLLHNRRHLLFDWAMQKISLAWKKWVAQVQYGWKAAQKISFCLSIFCSLQRCLGVSFHCPSPITCPAAAIKFMANCIYNWTNLLILFAHAWCMRYQYSGRRVYIIM